jgi:hypothetical protein
MWKVAAPFVALLLAFGAGASFAEMWDNYSLSKHVWHITRIKVQPNKLDEYLDLLRKTYVPGVEIGKKDGSLVDYRILMNQNRGGNDANVIIIEEYSSWSAVEPDKERDKRARTEMRQNLPKDQHDAIVDGYYKYRTFLDEGIYWSVDYPK